jgi:hypothetical protein
MAAGASDRGGREAVPGDADVGEPVHDAPSARPTTLPGRKRPFAEALRALEEPAASDDQSQPIVRELSKYGTSTVLRVCLQLGDGLADCLCTRLYEDLLVRSRSSAL